MRLYRNEIIIEEFSARWRALKPIQSGALPATVVWLRNFRLAEEHWNSRRWYDRDCIASYWGIFGSLKSTETSAIIQQLNKIVNIEEFSARWRALKQVRRFVARKDTFIEEFSARWRALKHVFFPKQRDFEDF